MNQLLEGVALRCRNIRVRSILLPRICFDSSAPCVSLYIMLLINVCDVPHIHIERRPSTGVDSSGRGSGPNQPAGHVGMHATIFQGSAYHFNFKFQLLVPTMFKANSYSGLFSTLHGLTRSETFDLWDEQ